MQNCHNVQSLKALPIMTILSPRPRVKRPTTPISLTASPTVAPFIAFNLETRLSAGCDTTAQNTPVITKGRDGNKGKQLNVSRRKSRLHYVRQEKKTLATVIINRGLLKLVYLGQAEALLYPVGIFLPAI